MPYEGKDLSMLIILPVDVTDETTGLEQVQRDTNTSRQHMNNLTSYKGFILHSWKRS